MKSYSFLLIALLLLPACKSSRIQEEPKKTDLSANPLGTGPAVTLEFQKGKSFNHPSFVLWAEDMEGKYLQTLFITAPAFVPCQPSLFSISKGTS